jgi:hypothetical protein
MGRKRKWTDEELIKEAGRLFRKGKPAFDAVKAVFNKHGIFNRERFRRIRQAILGQPTEPHREQPPQDDRKPWYLDERTGMA